MSEKVCLNSTGVEAIGGNLTSEPRSYKSSMELSGKQDIEELGSAVNRNSIPRLLRVDIVKVHIFRHGMS
jgi:hypothetical protein